MENNWIRIYNEIGENGSLLLIGINSYQDAELVPWPLIVADDICRKTSFQIKNIFLWYKEIGDLEGKDLVLNHIYIIFFVRSLSNYYFNKDSIREPHIFENIEWGGKRIKGKSAYHDRKVRRYSPKGRDPGNVFYRTSRDERGGITQFFEYSSKEIYRKMIQLLTKDNSTILTNIKDNDLQKVVNALKRRIKFLEVMN